MPTDNESIGYFQENAVTFVPRSKAANAGGVAVSGLGDDPEFMRIQWSAEEVDAKLLSIMQIYTLSVLITVAKMARLITSKEPISQPFKRWRIPFSLMG